MPVATITLRAVDPAAAAFPLLRTATTAAAALLDLPVPARWTWTVQAGGDTDPHAALSITSLDEALTAEAAEAAHATLTATMPWLSWATTLPTATTPPLPVTAAGTNTDLPVIADLTAPMPDPLPLDPDTTFGADLLGPFWRGIKTSTSAVRLTVTLLNPAARSAGPLGHISLASDAVGVLSLAGILAAALSRTPGQLQAAPRRTAPTVLPLSPGLLGACLTSVFLIPSAWSSRPPTPPHAVIERLTTTTPPHTVLFGGSGLGKTTLLEAVVEQRLATGRTTVVIDPHGDLAARAAVSAAALGVEVASVDFGDTDRPPLWNLTRPPAGTTPRAWVTDLIAALQASWVDADAQWFGPVYRRTMYNLLLPLALDPHGPWPIGRLHDLAAPRAAGRMPFPPDHRPSEGDRWRHQLLDRINDPHVTAGVWEAVDMMDGDRERHARTWLLSKLEPLLQHPGMRRIVDTPICTVDLDAVIRDGRSTVLAIPATAVGDEGATVLSMLAMRWLWHRVRRDGCPPGGLDIVLDEAHRMPAQLCQEILAEGRKYGVQLRLATQSPTLLAPNLRTALLTNAGTVATMRLGLEDALSVKARFADLATAQLCELKPREVALASTTRETAIGQGPAGRQADGGAALRTNHRCVAIDPRQVIVDRLTRTLSPPPERPARGWR